MRRKQISKPGKYGPLKLYRVHYQQAQMPDDPVPPYASLIRSWGYDADHVAMKFQDAPDADGWEITNIEPVFTY
jgi:hypothetical protein